CTAAPGFHGVCHRAGHFGPDPLAQSGLQDAAPYRDNFSEARASILENLRHPLPIKLRPNSGFPDLARHRSETAMVDFWANWVEAVRFTCEAQGVISARLMLFASAAPSATVEVERMISEKIVSFS